MLEATIDSTVTGVQSERDFVIASMCEIEELLAEHADVSAGPDLFSLIEHFNGYMDSAALHRLHELRMLRNDLAHNTFDSVAACPSKRRVRSRKDFERALEFVKAAIPSAARRRDRHRETEPSRSSRKKRTPFAIRVTLGLFHYLIATPFMFLFFKRIEE